jgi:hypothetical protein
MTIDRDPEEPSVQTGARLPLVPIIPSPFQGQHFDILCKAGIALGSTFCEAP